jgi:esterase/lipase superfamily enzyme
MKREYHRWYSPALQRDMELLLFGYAGARVLAFPTSAGRFFDWENRGLIAAIADQIENGWIQVCCVDSVDRESWYAYAKHPAQRVERHAQYDRYLHDEVLPLLTQGTHDPYVIVTGPSFGGYHAVNFGLRHPRRVNRILSMSGLCDIRMFTDGWYGDSLYFHNPVDFVAGEFDEHRLDQYRRLDIILAVGRDDRLRPSNEQMSQVLHSKRIHHRLRVWDGFAHDWPEWQRMLQLYLGGQN